MTILFHDPLRLLPLLICGGVADKDRAQKHQACISECRCTDNVYQIGKESAKPRDRC